MNVEWPMQRDKLAESGTLTRIRLTSRGLGLALGYASRIGGRRRSWDVATSSRRARAVAVLMAPQGR